MKHLGAQQVKNIPWEIIIVDNASTDNTAAVAKEYWSKYKAPGAEFKVIHQPIPGKNHAFKSGLYEAKYECLVI
ncbi:MAG TPA: glycosyltransferase family A protein, partial [Mucilaginibacter sp.]